MNMLTQTLKNYVEYGGRRFRTECSFDNVLEVQRWYKDERLTHFEKAEQALSMLTKERARIMLLSRRKKIELLGKIFQEQIALPKRHSPGNNMRILDFALDSEYIFASFMQDYHMDLEYEQGKLHWKKFIALFQGLSEHTKIKEIMKIRRMEVPAPTKYNQKERQNIMELKACYALPAEGGGGMQGLDMLFGALEAQAVKHG